MRFSVKKRIIVGAAIAAGATSSFANTCVNCVVGSHQNEVPIKTQVSEFVVQAYAHGENGPRDTRRQTVQCQSTVKGSRKYTLSGSIKFGDFGLSAGYEDELVTSGDCEAKAEFSTACTCAQANCGYRRKTTMMTISYCKSHSWVFFGNTGVCDCTVKGSNSGKLVEITAADCRQLNPHQVSGCGKPVPCKKPLQENL